MIFDVNCQVDVYFYTIANSVGKRERGSYHDVTPKS